MSRRYFLRLESRGKLLVALVITTVVIMIAFTMPAVAQETVLYSFNNDGTDGQIPFAGLVFDASGNLYGTTAHGGTYAGGTAFKLARKAGGGWSETVLHAFGNGVDGDLVYSALVFDNSGNLYGTTYFGGDHSYGTVFELTPTTGGSWTEKIIHSFNPNGTDGTSPVGSLIFDASGNLYGTTSTGGAYGGGTVFELTPSANGEWNEMILHDFHSNGIDGYNPRANLIFDASGNLYGTTLQGGIYGAGNFTGGTVFELTPSSNASWTETVLYSFDGIGTNAYDPDTGLIFDPAGDLYGTTLQGGAGPNGGYGSVFELTRQAGGGWTETVPHSFGNGLDGQHPFAGLIIDAVGNLYGTTWEGGNHGSGTVFELTRRGEKILYSFNNNGADGTFPYAGLVFDASGNLYGTTQSGGVYGSGTVFEIHCRARSQHRRHEGREEEDSHRGAQKFAQALCRNY